MSESGTLEFAEIVGLLRENADPEKAPGMRAYMRDQFEFLGVPAPTRRALTRAHIRGAVRRPGVDWEFIGRCWECEYRELQYVAADYLQAVQKRLMPDDIHRIKQLAQRKPWWDTIDSLDNLLGALAMAHPQTKEVLLDWSLDPDFWLRRIAIDHQLSLKEHTDNDLLEQIIVNNLGQTEFFINKAIGWALREYSKTDPEWVRDFVERHGERMSKLSVKEASKRL